MDKKRERKSFSIEETLRILEKVDSFHGTRAAQARELHISVSTLNTIVKNRATISASASQCGPNSKKRKYASYSRYDEMEEIVRSWFETARASGIPINGVLLRKKALKVKTFLHPTDGLTGFGNATTSYTEQCVANPMMFVTKLLKIGLLANYRI